MDSIISALYQKFARRIMMFILKRSGGDMEVAEIVLQDTFVAAFKSFHTFRNKSSYFTWLCKIAINKLADYYRFQVHYRSKIVIPTLEQLDSFLSPGLNPEEKLSLDELRLSVNQSMDLLPHKYRQLLHLKYYQQLSGREICVIMKLTPRQLEGRLYRARAAFAKTIAAVYPDSVK